MSADPNRPNVSLFYERKQRMDLGRKTPVWSDEKFPTQPLRIINMGHGYTANGKVSGSAWLMGSRALPGTPDEIMYGLQYTHLQTNTPNVYFALTHSRGTPRGFGANPSSFPGTIHLWYLAAKGEIETIGNVNENILEAIPPGTIRLYALGPGSSKTFSGSSVPTWQGVGTKGAVTVSAQLNFMPV